MTERSHAARSDAHLHSGDRQAAVGLTGYFRYHGLWAPGVRLFRVMPFAAKSALIAMCEALHVDLGLQGITVQAVCPGYVKTPLTDANDYAMPFLLELDDAVQRICNGFERKGFEIAFPKRMEFLLKALNMLPRSAYLAIMRRAGMRKPKAK